MYIRSRRHMHFSHREAAGSAAHRSARCDFRCRCRVAIGCPRAGEDRCARDSRDHRSVRTIGPQNALRCVVRQATALRCRSARAYARTLALRAGSHSSTGHSSWQAHTRSQRTPWDLPVHCTMTHRGFAISSTLSSAKAITRCCILSTGISQHDRDNRSCRAARRAGDRLHAMGRRWLHAVLRHSPCAGESDGTTIRSP